MKSLANALKDETIEALLSVAEEVLSGNSAKHQVWTNYAWESQIVLGSTTVICIAVPDDLRSEVKAQLSEAGLIDLNLSQGVMIYIWPNGSYIPPHTDRGYKQAISIYLNKDWSLSDGGLFCYESSDGIRCVVPEYNTGIENINGVRHFTTPVTSNKKRISLQVFSIDKN